MEILIHWAPPERLHRCGCRDPACPGFSPVPHTAQQRPPRPCSQGPTPPARGLLPLSPAGGEPEVGSQRANATWGWRSGAMSWRCRNPPGGFLLLGMLFKNSINQIYSNMYRMQPFSAVGHLCLFQSETRRRGFGLSFSSQLNGRLHQDNLGSISVFWQSLSM